MSDKQKIKVSCVSYTNSLPFLYGFEHSLLAHDISVTKDVPSECARKLKSGEAEVGIVPVGALLDFDYYEIISNFCIGATGPVDSVFIFSQKPLAEIETIRLDQQSRTSNGLARVLMAHFWKKEVTWVRKGEADAYVEIGDRTFGKKDQVPYAYDLAEQWQKWTGLPFAFAVWIAIKPLPQSFKERFDEAIAFGLQHKKEVVDTFMPREDFDYLTYLEENIDYRFDEKKQQAVKLYLSLLTELPQLGGE
jgi:chorismate dehydratase